MYSSFDTKPKEIREPPYLENYLSDYYQLSFYYRENAKEGAYYENEESMFTSIHQISMNLWALKLSYNCSFDLFIKTFIKYWNHEYFHMIGLTEKGLDIIRELGMNI